MAGDLGADGSGLDYSQSLQAQTASARLPMWDALGETASDDFMGTTRELGDYLSLENASVLGPAAGDAAAPIDAAAMNTEYHGLGVNFTPDMNKATAQLLIQQKQQEQTRDAALRDYPSGLPFQAANLATSFAVGALDPLNVAASFVPVVGEARYALWAERYGSTVARVARGGVEGAVGTAALQPLAYAQAKNLQDQYTPYDAFTNVAFGTVLGGGLHAITGAVGDALSRAQPETREAALRSSVGQMVEGRNVDVSPVMASDPATAPLADSNSPAESDFGLPEPANAVGTETLPAGFVEPPEGSPVPAPDALPVDHPDSDEYQAALADVKAIQSPEPTDTTFLQQVRSLGGLRVRKPDGKLTPEGGDLMSIFGDNPGHVMSLVNNRGGALGSSGRKVGLYPDQMLAALKEHSWLGPDADMSDLLDAVSRSIGGEKIFHPDNTDILSELAYRDLIAREMGEAGISTKEKPAEAARMLAEYRDEEGRRFASQEWHGFEGYEDHLSQATEERLHSDDDWIGSDEWLARESAGVDAGSGPDAAEGVPAAASGREPVAGRSGGGEAAGGEANGPQQVPSEFSDALNAARQRSSDFASGNERSSVEPSDEAVSALQASAKDGDDPEAALQSLREEIAGYRAQGIISEDEGAKFDAENAADDEAANTREQAAQAAARCLLLHP